MISNTKNSLIADMMHHASPEEAATMAAIAQTDKSRKAAKMERKMAQQDQIEMMRESANKLREMAKKALYSGIYQGVIGSVRAGASIGSTFCKDKSMSAKALNAVNEGAAPLQSIDPFKLSSERDEAERAEIDVKAEAASHRSSGASDEVGQANQVLSRYIATLDRIQNAQHKAELEGSKL